MSIYFFEYTSETERRTYEQFPEYDNFTRPVTTDSDDFNTWVAKGNTPEKKLNTSDRFLSVVDNEVVVNPNKDKILAKEAADKAIADVEQARQMEEMVIKMKLQEIDLKSIRSIREYIAAKADAPAYLKAYEAEAKTEREKITN